MIALVLHAKAEIGNKRVRKEDADDVDEENESTRYPEKRSPHGTENSW
jgi:hypothetical protein